MSRPASRQLAVTLTAVLVSARTLGAMPVTGGISTPPQEVLARLDPLGAGLVPATAFGASAAYLPSAEPPALASGGGEDGPVVLGDVVAIGAPEDPAVGHRRGAVQVFVRRRGGFDRERHLLPSQDQGDPATLSAAERFGAALDALPRAGDTLLAIGAPGRDVGCAGHVVADAGGITLVRRVAGGFQRVAELAAPAPAGGARFGASVALGALASDDLAGTRDTQDRSDRAASGALVAVVGAPGATRDGRALAGEAIVFVGRVAPRGAGDGAAQRQLAPRVTLAAPRPALAAAFGAAVALVRDARGIDAGPAACCVAVAAPGDPVAGPGAGAVFLFDLAGHLLDVRRPAPAVHRGQPSGTRYGERIVALGDGRLAVAAPARGVVEVLRVEGGVFVPEALLVAHPVVGFGLGLAGAPGTVVVGAPFAGPGAPATRVLSSAGVEVAAADGAGAARDLGPGSPALLGAGRVVVHRRIGGVWCAAPVFDAAPALDPIGNGQEARDELGHALALGRDGAVLVVTAPAARHLCAAGVACDAGGALVAATLPVTRPSTATDAGGRLELLGSGRVLDHRARFVIGGTMPGRFGALRATWAGATVGTVVAAEAPRGVVLGAASADGVGRWQVDAPRAWARLSASAPGASLTFFVAWRDGAHSSAVIPRPR